MKVRQKAKILSFRGNIVGHLIYFLQPTICPFLLALLCAVAFTAARGDGHEPSQRRSARSGDAVAGALLYYEIL